MFETSAEWPHLAAIERGRRQRAALAFEQSLRGRSLLLTRQSSRGRPQQVQAAGQQSRQPGRPHASDEVLLVDSSGQERPNGEEKLRVTRHRSDPARRSAPADVRDLSTDGE